MDAALPSGATSHDFFRRARARLTLDVPRALDDSTDRLSWYRFQPPTGTPSRSIIWTV
jgi:hypothetical protein